MELEKLLGKLVLCEKVGAIRYKEGHPNGINKGYITGGVLKSISPYIKIDTGFGYFRSSIVATIKGDVEGDLVYTQNSIYRITEFKKDKI